MAIPPGHGTESPAYKVLLIEEDPQQTDLYADLVRETVDCQVDVITRLDTALEWLSRLDYHLIVLDTSSRASNESDALALLERLRQASPTSAIILIAESATVEEAVAAIRLGAEDYLKKPLNIEAFQLSVKRGLDRKTVFDESSGASAYLGLLNSCQMISASRDLDRIFFIVQSYLVRELRSHYSAIYRNKGGVPSRIEAHTSDSRDRAMEEILDIALQASNPLPKMVEAGEFYRFVDRGQLTPGLFVFRFRCVGEADYFCVCLSPERPAAIEAFESRLRLLRAQLEVTGKSIEQYIGVQHLAYVDDVTGLYNTRYLNNILDREIAQATGTQKPFAILFIDADKFKGINDQYGHLVGSRLLNELGHQLKKFVREKDTVFRYGGDEFVAVLSRCDLATARSVAERIRQSVEHRKFLAREGLNIHFTVSIGVALFPEHANSKKSIIEAADRAMYSAKRTTRNSVFIADVGGGSSG